MNFKSAFSDAVRSVLNKLGENKLGDLISAVFPLVEKYVADQVAMRVDLEVEALFEKELKKLSEDRQRILSEAAAEKQRLLCQVLSVNRISREFIIQILNARDASASVLSMLHSIESEDFARLDVDCRLALSNEIRSDTTGISGTAQADIYRELQKPTPDPVLEQVFMTTDTSCDDLLIPEEDAAEPSLRPVGFSTIRDEVESLLEEFSLVFKDNPRDAFNFYYGLLSFLKQKSSILQNTKTSL